MKRRGKYVISVAVALIAVGGMLTSGARAYPAHHATYVRDCKDLALQQALPRYGVVLLRVINAPAGFAHWTPVGRLPFDQDTPGCVTTLYTDGSMPDNGGTPRTITLEYEVITVDAPAAPGSAYPRWAEVAQRVWNNWAFWRRLGL